MLWFYYLNVAERQSYGLGRHFITRGKDFIVLRLRRNYVGLGLARIRANAFLIYLKDGHGSGWRIINTTVQQS